MLNGRAIIAGKMFVDGVEEIGVFVRCSRDELKANSSLVFEDVTVTLAEVADSPDTGKS